MSRLSGRVCRTRSAFSSGADFELLGPGDVDNPAVPNMPGLGWNRGLTATGSYCIPASPIFRAEHVDQGSLPRVWDEGGRGPREWVRFPRDVALDVIAIDDNDAQGEQRALPCDEDVHGNFDRLPGGFIEHGPEVEYSVHPPGDRLHTGRPCILQDTNTSSSGLAPLPA